MIIRKLDNILIEKGIYDEDPIIQDNLLEGLDSLSFIELIVAIETEFEIGISDEYLLLSFFNKKEKIIEIIKKMLNDGYKTVSDVVKANKCIGCLACIELCPHGKLQTNADILPTLISEWRKMGYSFGTLDELTG